MKEVTVEKKFLPADYIRPDRKKQFLKFKEGSTRFRILTAALLGWVLFDKDGKPHRKAFQDPFTEEEVSELKPKKNDDGTDQMPKHFWAFGVWDYGTASPKVLEVTQTSIMTGMEGYLEDEEDFGSDPTQYDFIVDREGSTKENTSYSVRVKPKKALQKAVLDIVNEEMPKADIPAMLTGEYPFKEYTFD